MDTNGHKKICQTYITILKDEIALFGGFTAQIEELKDVVKKRDWEELEETINRMNETGKAIGYIEEKRNTQFLELKRSLGLGEKVRLKELLKMCETDMGRKISDFSSALKYEVIRVQATAKSLGYYVHGVYDLIYHILEELYPYTKGKIYSREGKTKQADQIPVMINRKL
ncbi:MAG: flagellar export chaperone FlgN [Spirochaetales bacterium]|nr:flagellar export chaperone FlgN [Spirochaetales bacterium]